MDLKLIVLFLVISETSFGSSWYESHSPWGAKDNHVKQINIAKYQASLAASKFEKEESIVSLELYGDAVIKGSRALVGDVLDCKGNDILCQDINSIDLGIDLSRVNKKTLSQNRVMSIVEQEGYTTKFAMLGSRAVKISRKVYQIPGEEIRADIKSVLDENLHCGSGCKLDLHVSPIYRKFTRLVKDWEIRITNLDQLSLKMGSGKTYTTLKVHWEFVDDSSQTYKTFVKPFKQVKALTFNKYLPKGNLVDGSMVEYAWVNYSDMPKDYVEPNLVEKSFKLKRSVKNGQIVSSRALLLPYLIKRGQMVEVISGTKGLSVKMKGKAMNNGHLGEDVTVRIKGKRLRKIVGKARSAGVVELL